MKGIYKGKPVAAKIIKKGSCEEEAKIMEDLSNCENTVKVLAHSENCIVMDYIKNDLDHFLSKRTRYLKVTEIQKIVKQILEALVGVHAKGYSHRDLKPNNILIDQKSKVQLADFGLARKTGNSVKCSPQRYKKIYRPPEMLVMKNRFSYSSYVDMWAMGCVFMEIFCHKPLFSRRDGAMQLSEIAEKLGTPTKEGSSMLFRNKSRAMREYYKSLLVADPNFDLTDLFPPHYPANVIEAAADLAKRMLTWDYKKRITAEDALNHYFFLL
jgi:serine/threonine protein kinase